LRKRRKTDEEAKRQRERECVSKKELSMALVGDSHLGIWNNLLMIGSEILEMGTVHWSMDPPNN